jgi:hypothetical protein
VGGKKRLLKNLPGGSVTIVGMAITLEA